jgi:hypothetical protein
MTSRRQLMKGISRRPLKTIFVPIPFQEPVDDYPTFGDRLLTSAFIFVVTLFFAVLADVKLKLPLETIAIGCFVFVGVLTVARSLIQKRIQAKRMKAFSSIRETFYRIEDMRATASVQQTVLRDLEEEHIKHIVRRNMLMLHSLMNEDVEQVRRVRSRGPITQSAQHALAQEEILKRVLQGVKSETIQ